MNQSKCRECKKPIMWIQMITGKWMPCDPERRYYTADPTAESTFITSGGKTVRGREVGKGKSGRFGFRAHWATCVHSEYFKRMKQERERAEERVKRQMYNHPGVKRHPSREGNRPEEILEPPVMEQFSIL